MNKRFIVLLLIAFVSCNGKSQSDSADSSPKKMSDTSKIAVKAIDTTDNDDNTPTPADERKKLSKTYNDIKIIDSTFIGNNDTLHFHLKYYCLKDSKIIVPKTYTSDEKNPQDYTTYGFASDVLLIHNKDTVLKKQFKAIDFNPFFHDNFGGNLKKYGSILMPRLARKNKDKSRMVLDYPISIPATDIGVGLFLVISKNGDYKVVENY